MIDAQAAAALAPLIARVRTDVTAVKGEAGQRWTSEPLTSERLARHLNGGPARGVGQIKPGESVTLVAILDFDSHQGEVAWSAMVDVAGHVANVLELAYGLAPILWRSSGGRGVHLYLLWDEPQDAYSVRALLREALATCGLRNGTKGVGAGQVEVFPKQDSVPADGFGNQVVLPLAGASVPLVWEELLPGWVAGSREDACAAAWRVSDPVPVLAQPERAPRAVAGADLAELRDLLSFDTNRLDYDRWRDMLFATHHETDGSDEGFALIDEFSSHHVRYTLAETVKQWNYAHSAGRERVVGIGTMRYIASKHGWEQKFEDVFSDVSADDNARPLPPERGAASVARLKDAIVVDAGAPVPPRVPKGVKRRGIPEAHHLTTDQANANRLVNAFGRQVFVAAGRWHVWDGRRWLADEADVYRYGCRLSGIVRGEATAVEARAALTGDPAEITKAAGIAKALRAWALKSEMKGTIEAAIGLARKMLTIDEAALDRDPALLNVWNGTVDLRTGQIRAHNPEDFITKLAGCAFDAAAPCDVWERSLAAITREDGSSGSIGAERAGAPLASFLQRWAGYCLTGLTVEQVFAVLWGSGSNGKSTVVELWAEAMGDYAATAAPGLMMAAKGERHPTEIASLRGRRMVTAHESGEGVVLREDFIKQATGGDKMTARFMRADFFEFSPTHKLQLLTNHKPQVKGQDRGIWRRVLLVPFLASFGDAEAVRDGRATALADVDLVARLRGELPGVLAWMVRGAVAWFDGGLRPPAQVREASDAYKTEQDRVGQFVAECCERDVLAMEALTDGMGGLYPAYVSWARDGGVMPLSKSRFADDVLRVVGVERTVERQSPVENGKRRKMKMVPGIRLLAD